MSSPTIFFENINHSVPNLHQENISNESVLSSDGIIFFKDHHSCLSHFNNTSLIKKIISFITSIGTFFAASFTYIFNQFNTQEIIPYTNIDNIPLNTKKLIVCIHGLDSSPFQFKKIINKIEKIEDPSRAIFAPYVLQKGNATLDEMCEEIYNSIKPWTEHGQGKKLILIGFSNGARIALALEALLAKEAALAKINNNNIKKIESFFIAGACQGSSRVDLAHRLGLSCLLSENIAKEIPTTSERNKRLKEDWEKYTKEHFIKREHTLFASSDDWVIPNIESSLPTLNHSTTRYAIVTGHGHLSILNRVTKKIAQLVTLNKNLSS